VPYLPAVTGDSLVATMSRTARVRNSGAASARGKDPAFEKGRRTRQKLLNAAERVFQRDGFLDARIADIAKTARVSHGTFYTYFDSKEEVFREVASVVIDEMYRALDQAVQGQRAVDLIASANTVFIDVYATHAPMLALIEQVATFDEHFRQARLDLRRRLVRRVDTAIAGMCESGEAQIDGLDRHVLAHALAGMAENFAYAWFILNEPFERDVALRTLNTIWARVLEIDMARRAPVAAALGSGKKSR
jgi:AcrR family transcriptional regulator